jgi:alkaline phosphatase D
MHRFYSIAILLSLATAGASETPLTRIAFGSCCHQDKPKPIFNAVLAVKPHAFLFLGDNVYADTEDVAVMRGKYAKLDADTGFAALREMCPILGVWDDHDYGVNDGGASYPMREASQREFAAFFRLPADSPVRQRPGIYDARRFGPEGRVVQIIQLDARYFRGSLVKLPQKGEFGPYTVNLDPAATVLGEAQWLWLAEQLREPADLRVVMSSYQFLPQDHGWECWENFPAERARFLRLLKETGAGGVIVLSGDRHMGEIMKLPVSDPLSPGAPVWEITSSGLTNGGGGTENEPNRHRVSPGVYRDLNFGLLEIDWEKRQVNGSIRRLDGETVFSAPIALDDLRLRR